MNCFCSFNQFIYNEYKGFLHLIVLSDLNDLFKCKIKKSCIMFLIFILLFLHLFLLIVTQVTKSYIVIINVVIDIRKALNQTEAIE